MKKRDKKDPGKEKRVSSPTLKLFLDQKKVDQKEVEPEPRVVTEGLGSYKSVKSATTSSNSSP
jgi:hypothetical protein